MADLNELIDWSAVECLNQQPDHSIQNALKQARRGGAHGWGAVGQPAGRTAAQQALPFCMPVRLFTLQGYREDDGLYLESDTDEQLL